MHTCLPDATSINNVTKRFWTQRKRHGYHRHTSQRHLFFERLECRTLLAAIPTDFLQLEPSRLQFESPVITDQAYYRGAGELTQVADATLRVDGNALYVISRSNLGSGRVDSIFRLDAKSGERSIPFFVPGQEEGGIIFVNQTTLLAAAQRTFIGPRLPAKEGEVLDGGKLSASVFRYPGTDLFIADNNEHSLIDPATMLLQGNQLYIADTRSAEPTTPGDPIPDGRIRRYDVSSGVWIDDMIVAGYLGQFHPSGMVFDSSGSLYVSLFDANADANPSDAFNSGYGAIIKIDPDNQASVLIAFNNGDEVNDLGEAADLHHPGSLAFGPEGKLYVATRSTTVNELDKIVVLDPNASTPFAQVDQIEITRVSDAPLHPRAILFGPSGKLFVSLNEPESTQKTAFRKGYIRSYDVNTKSFTMAFSSRVGPVGYFTFGDTNPATLEFGVSSASAAPVLGGIQTTITPVAQPILTRNAEATHRNSEPVTEPLPDSGIESPIPKTKRVSVSQEPLIEIERGPFLTIR
ncbi:hypothetical protein SH528x_004657 [Novipirellula sp. SH528]|uniref:hypothetical protein n=1 Tax=Novipirellula sp. SH528 TaxID=3454466 RepID=UPI003FA0CC8C